MYTRSYPKRSLPPDYGGTALTVHLPEEGGTREAIAAPLSSDSANRRPRRPPFGRESRPARPPIPPPFGGNGVEEEPSLRAEAQKSAPPQEPTPPSESLSTGAEERPSFLHSLWDSSFKSDDLLLLGLALLLLSDKDRPEGESCADALLLLAMLYVSGLT